MFLSGMSRFLLRRCFHPFVPIDIIPCPIPLIEALLLKREREREQLEDNPALAHLSPPPSAWMPPLPMHEAMDCDVSKRKKSRNANGNEYKRSKKSAAGNGHPAPQVTHGTMDRDTSESYADQHTNQFKLHRQDSSAMATIPTVYINGTHTPPFEEPVNATSPHPPVHYPGAHSPPYHSEEEPQWTGSTPSYTGPASGFLQGQVPSYSPSTVNPGRTIYSQPHS